MRRPIQFAPGVSVNPWTMIEVNTTSAARLKIRSPAAMPRLSTSSENVIVATPLGPNQAMNAFVSESSPVRTSAANSATGRARSSVTATIPTAAQPSPNSPSIVSSEPNTTKITSLTTSMMSSARCSKAARTSGRRMPSVMAQVNTAMKAFPWGSIAVTP